MATPFEKTKFKTEAQERAMPVFAAKEKTGEEKSYRVSGYAALYEPYVLYEDEDGPVYERFEPGCFENTDMTDVIMQYDHAGRVFARTTNGTLEVKADEIGLHFDGDLSSTESSRSMYADIEAKLVTKMSWRFTTGVYYYDKQTRTIVHRTVKKVWDVSAVSIPANQNTEINARSFGNGVIAEAARREAELDERRRKLALKIKL